MNYLIDPEAVLQGTMNDLLVGLSADEALPLAQLSRLTVTSVYHNIVG